MDINAILEDVGWGRYQYYVIITCSLAWACTNFWFVGTAIAIDELSLAWNITALESGMMAASLSAGSLVGAVLLGYIADVYGRLVAFKITGYIYVIFGIIMTVSINIWMVIVWFFFVGASFGADNTLTGTILTDFLPLSKRYILPLLTVTWATGSLIIVFIGLMLNIYEVEPIVIFRVVIGFITFWLIVQLIMRFYMDESPKYLLTVGQQDKALEVLEKMAKGNSKNLKLPSSLSQLSTPSQVDEEFEETSPQVDSKLDATPSKREKITHTDPLLDNSSDQQQSKVKIIYSKPYLATTIRLNIVWFCLGSGVGLQAFMPLILQRATGSSPSQSFIYLVLLIQQIASMPGNLLAAKLMETFVGRRFTSAIGFIGCGVFSFFYNLQLNEAAVLAISAISWFFLYMGYSSNWTITPESYKADVRSFGQGTSCGFLRAGAILTTLVIGALFSAGQYYICICYFAVALVMCGAVSATLPETRGTDIDSNLKI